MFRIILLSLVLCISFDKSFSQCTETPVPKVLLVGDSWAWYMNTDGTINEVFKTWGHSNYKFVSNGTLSENGADTRDFILANKEAEILHQLTINPTIEVVHLSIGGNDFLGDWNVSMTQAQTDSLTDGVFVRLDSIIRFIKNCKPGIKILWSGYCYTNFKEVITRPGGLGSNHPFYNTWHGMGDPDFAQINSMQNSISVKIDDYCATHPDVYYFNANALMQYVYGQPAPLAVAPGGTYPAFSVPMPLGDPNYPSPVVSMRDYDLIFVQVPDCYHLSAEGYRYLVAYHTQKFYHKLLMDDQFLLSDNNTQTGSVSSLGNVSNSLYVGAASGEQFSTVLSFNTTSMPDTTLSKASIFLRRMNLTGSREQFYNSSDPEFAPVLNLVYGPTPGSGNPGSGSLLVKVKNGNFGSSLNVEAADYTDAADASATPCLFGSSSHDGDWVRIDLPAQLLSHITNAAPTQFVISAPGMSGIQEATGLSEFLVYPNPTTGLLSIESGSETILNVEVKNLLGEVVLHPHMHLGSIDISSLSNGMYVLDISSMSGRTSQRIFKN